MVFYIMRCPSVQRPSHGLLQVAPSSVSDAHELVLSPRAEYEAQVRSRPGEQGNAARGAAALNSAQPQMRAPLNGVLYNARTIKWCFI